MIKGGEIAKVQGMTTLKNWKTAGLAGLLSAGKILVREETRKVGKNQAMQSTVSLC